MGSWSPLETGVSPFTFIDEDRANFPQLRFYRALEAAGAGGQAAMMAGGAPTRAANQSADGGGDTVAHPAQPRRVLPTSQQPPETLSDEERRNAQGSTAKWLEDILADKTLSDSDRMIFEEMLEATPD